jgi:hypothetical protein
VAMSMRQHLSGMLIGQPLAGVHVRRVGKAWLLQAIK